MKRRAFFAAASAAVAAATLPASAKEVRLGDLKIRDAIVPDYERTRLGTWETGVVRVGTILEWPDGSRYAVSRMHYHDKIAKRSFAACFVQRYASGGCSARLVELRGDDTIADDSLWQSSWGVRVVG